MSSQLNELKGETSLENVGHWECTFEPYVLFPAPFFLGSFHFSAYYCHYNEPRSSDMVFLTCCKSRSNWGKWGQIENLWNYEPEWIFHPLSYLSQAFCHSDEKLTQWHKKIKRFLDWTSKCYGFQPLRYIQRYNNLADEDNRMVVTIAWKIKGDDWGDVA